MENTTKYEAMIEAAEQAAEDRAAAIAADLAYRFEEERSSYQEACESGELVAWERRHEADGPGARLWDADPEVCCAAFQLGACQHTEGGYEDDPSIAEGFDEWRARFPVTPAPMAGVASDEEPF